MRYQPAEQLLRLALILRARRHSGVTLNEVAQQLEVSRKTAQRMKDALGRLFPDLAYRIDEEGQKRWFLGAETALDINPSAADIASLDLAADLLDQHGLAPLSDAVSDLSHRIQSSLDRRTSLRIEPDLELLLEAEGLAQRPGPHPKIDPMLIADIRSAILSSNLLAFEYRGLGKRRSSKRVVAPYGFLFGYRHYLVAKDQKAKALRMFVLGQMSHVERSDEHFVKDPNFNLNSYAEQSFGAWHDGKPFQVRLVFTAESGEQVQAHHFHTTQSIVETQSGDVEVSFTAESAKEICFELFRWGRAIKAIEPVSLEQTYKTMLQEATQAIET